jgi:hypothetical protein
MNETFEKIDFFEPLNPPSTLHSFYNFSKNPIINISPNDLNFYENYHIEFNINKMIFNKDYLGNDENADLNSGIIHMDIHKESCELDFPVFKEVPLTHEDFNNMEECNYFEDDLNLKNNVNSSNTNNTVTKTNENLADKYKVFSHRNKDPGVKKIITKEFFSQQTNSLNNIYSKSCTQLSEISEIETRYGISEGAYQCPDYNSFSEDKLKEEMKKYGLKAGSVKFMVKTLGQIWEFLNMSIFIVYFQKNYQRILKMT